MKNLLETIKNKGSAKGENKGNLEQRAAAAISPDQDPAAVVKWKCAYIVIIIFTGLLFWSYSAHAQEQRQVVVTKSNEIGQFYNAYINVPGGVMQFVIFDQQNNKKAFDNFKELLDYMAKHGYKLTSSVKLASPGDADRYVYIQYVFELQRGEYPLLKIII